MHPKKRYGQHFLRDRAVIERIVAAIVPQAGDHIVEIGPGEGALTLPLLQKVGHLTAVELDANLVGPLRQRAATLGELELIHADILQIDLAALAKGSQLRMIGNLPYYISSPILFHCLAHAEAIADIHFTLQREVVDRLAASPGRKTYGRLSVMVQLACTVQPLLYIARDAFRPPPRVDSAMVRLTLLPATQRPDAGLTPMLAAVVRAAFGQRRKTLANALRSLLDSGTIRGAGIDPRARAEHIPPDGYVALAECLRSRDLQASPEFAENAGQ